jgi:O-antigen/teichoic acid export membrane protein
MLRMLVIPGALAGVLFPRFAGGPEKTATMPLATIYQRGIRAVGAMMLPLCILAATGAYDGIRVWLGDEFALNSYRVVAIVAVGVYANAIAHLPFAWLQASGRADLTATMHLIELPLYAAGLIACAIQWGIIGAAAVWAVRVSIDCVVLLWLAQRDGISAILVRLLGGMGLIAIAAIVADPHWHWQWRLALSTSFMLIGVYTAWMHVLRMEDRLQLRNLIRVA